METRWSRVQGQNVPKAWKPWKSYTNFVIPAEDRWFFKEVWKAAPKLEGHALSQRPCQYKFDHTHTHIYIYIIRATKGPRNVKKQTIRNRCFTVSIENRICWHMFVSVFVRCQNVYFCGGSHTKQHVIYFFSSSGLWSAFLGIAFAKRQELAQLWARLSSSRNQPVENLQNPGSSGNLGRLGRHPSCQPLPRGRFTRRPFCVPQPCMGGTCSEEWSWTPGAKVDNVLFEPWN